jgi:2-desacetyl-2-hydroxyethyl bacteriochlorophyllide A dehydrogenase
MKSLVIESVGVSRLAEVPDPHPVGAGEVLIKVDFVGLCGSDLNTFMGTNPLALLPRTPGHEISGTVLTPGDGVGAPLDPGARVVVVPYTSCGRCSACRNGRTNACRFNRTLGVQQEGGLSELLVVPADKLIVNATLPQRHLALVEPLSVGFHAVTRGGVQKSDRVLVLGCGMIGIGVVLGAVARGAEVIAVDLGSQKRDLARAMGASHFIASAEVDLSSAIAELTEGNGVDVVIEAVGVPETFTKAIDLACFTGRVVYVGYSKLPVTYETSLFNLKELDIRGSRNASRADFEAVIQHLETMGETADALVSRVFPLNEAAQALPYWLQERSDTFKILVAC